MDRFKISKSSRSQEYPAGTGTSCTSSLIPFRSRGLQEAGFWRSNFLSSRIKIRVLIWEVSRGGVWIFWTSGDFYGDFSAYDLSQESMSSGQTGPLSGFRRTKMNSHFGTSKFGNRPLGRGQGRGLCSGWVKSHFGKK